MKISEFENEAAIELIADLIDPVSEILSDSEVAQAGRSKNKVLAVKLALKNHAKSVVEILALLDGTTPEEYKKNVAQMTVELLEMLNDKDLMEVFHSQSQINSESFGSAMENIEADEK